jgi:catechol 2,3-dioxygenase-like lactoylglutathione lyase family enzyme
MPLVQSLDHINIRTADLERTCEFFIGVLGLEKGWRPDFGIPGAWLYADGKDVVHLVGVEKPLNASSTASLDHFAFHVSDYEDALARVKATGYSFYELTTPGTTVRQIFVKESNGVTVELNWKGDRPRG